MCVVLFCVSRAVQAIVQLLVVCAVFFVCHVQSRQGYGYQECAVLFLTCALTLKRALAQTLGVSLA